MVGPTKDSNGQQLQNAVLKYVTKTFDEADWIELGIETGTLEVIQGHDRLLRALSWGDPDYAAHAVDVTKKILKSMGDGAMPDVEQVKVAFPRFKAWSKENDLGMYRKLFGPAPASPEKKSSPRGNAPSVGDAAPRAEGVATAAPELTKATPGSAAQSQPVPTLAAKAAQQEPEIFIVHGHDHHLRNEVHLFLQRVTGTNPVVLDFEASGGKTLIEKFEAKASEASVAVVLLTPDDIGAAKSSPSDLQPRARQNVVFEMGFFVGSLTRSRVITINDGVETPSDVAGLVYIPRDAPNWYEKLRKELVAAGVKLIA